MSTPRQPVGDPRQLLAETRDLAHRVRRAQRGTGVALLVLGLAVLLAIPFYEYGHDVLTHCQTSAAGRVCARYPTLAFWYWPVALVAAYTLVGVIFVRRARSRGVGARVRSYVIGGILLAAAALLLAWWDLGHPLSWIALGGGLQPGSAALGWLYRLVGPLGVIGLGLLVLARVERSRALAGFSIVYLIAVAGSAPIGTHTGRIFLPGVLVPALVLLAGSVLFAVLERPDTPGAP
jgi:hypothetical protein